jgi:hypothetical protein
MSSEAQKSRSFALDERVRGIVVMVAGVAALVGIAYGAMTLITAPDGWAMKAANSPSAEAGAETPQFASEVPVQ